MPRVTLDDMSSNV